MKFKKLATLVLSILMITVQFSAMCGCGEKDNSKGSGDGGFGGRTIVIGQATDGTPKEDSDTYAEDIEYISSLEKKYNCKIEWYSTNNWHTYHEEIRKKALAGEKIADMFWASGTEIFPKWVLNDLVAPLDDYFDFTDKLWIQSYNEYVVYNGQHYGITNWIPTLGSAMFFNKKLCASYGISDSELYDLVKNGQWTWDKFLSYAKKCTKIGANEDSSSYGFASLGLYSAMDWIYANGDEPVLRKGNSYIYNLDSSKCLEGIQFAYDLFHKYKVTPSKVEAGVGQTLFEKGKVAFAIGAMWQFPEVAEALKEDEIGILLIPKGPKAEDYINVNDFPEFLFMQPQVEDKELLAKLAKDLYTPQEWQKGYGKENEPSFNYSDYYFDEDSAQILDMTVGRTIVNSGTYSTEFRDKIWWSYYGIDTATDPRTWVDSQKATGQYYLDSIWSQEIVESVTE